MINTAAGVAIRIAVAAAEANVIEIAGEAPQQWCVAALRTSATVGSSRTSTDADEHLLQPRSVRVPLHSRLCWIAATPLCLSKSFWYRAAAIILRFYGTSIGNEWCRLQVGTLSADEEGE